MKICVLGAGSWGITLAYYLKNINYQVKIWSRSTTKSKSLNKNKTFNLLHSKVILQTDVKVMSDIKQSLEDAELVILAVPSHALRNTLILSKDYWPKKAVALSAVKGLEMETHLRMSEIFNQIMPNHEFSVISGPSHAEELAKNIPTALVVASKHLKLAKFIQKKLSSNVLRLYTSSDLIGVELGGAFKNVIAIAAGILDGMRYGDNTKAALITRGLYEMTNLGISLGAQSHTFSGLAGMGDLIVTCISRFSRNRLLGEKIASGITVNQALSQMSAVAEGVKTSQSTWLFSKEKHVETPIMNEVYSVLYKKKTIQNAVKDLLSRSLKPENRRLK
jgi:glycerol-3-phosphate dehydrogenase (NAD(P)+)